MKNFLIAAFVSFLVLVNSTVPRAQEIRKEGNDIYATDMLSASVSIDQKRKIMIRSATTLRGKVEIVAVDGNKVSVTYKKKSKADSRSEAIDYIDLIDVVLDATAEGARLHMRAPNPAPWGEEGVGLVEATLSVPKGAIIETEARYFDLFFEGPLAGVYVPDSYGRLKVANVDGVVDLATVNRRITLENITGEINVSTTNSTLSAVQISSLSEQAQFRNEGGDIHIDGFVGSLSIKNSYGRIEVEDFTPSGTRNFVRGFSGPIYLELTKFENARLRVSNQFEDIELDLPPSVSAVLSLTVDESGKIKAGNFPFTTELVETNRMDLVTGAGESILSASVRGEGNIYVRGSE
jgi:hypothetical protein